MDIQVTDKTVFYRLRQADKDGTESITPLVLLVQARWSIP